MVVDALFSYKQPSITSKKPEILNGMAVARPKSIAFVDRF
jgi:hypothetical protein